MVFAVFVEPTGGGFGWSRSVGIGLLVAFCFICIFYRIFSTTANLLNLSCDIIFVDTSSTYFECDVADDEAEAEVSRLVWV